MYGGKQFSRQEQQAMMAAHQQMMMWGTLSAQQQQQLLAQYNQQYQQMGINQGFVGMNPYMQQGAHPRMAMNHQQLMA